MSKRALILAKFGEQKARGLVDLVIQSEGAIYNVLVADSEVAFEIEGLEGLFKRIRKYDNTCRMYKGNISHLEINGYKDEHIRDAAVYWNLGISCSR